MNLLIGAVTIGLILSLLALGVYISFRIFSFPDITTEGSITMGASIAAILLTKNVNPILATGLAFAGGALAGATTGVLHTKFKIHGLLSGILVMTALYSVNLHIMGKSNVPLLSETTLATYADNVGRKICGETPFRILHWEISVHDASVLMASLIGISITGAFLYLFFRTNLGTSMRATGDNPQMIRALGVNVESRIILGLAVSNGLVALSGALLAQYQGFADVQMGIGMVVWGLASVIIGEALVGSSSLGLLITGAVMGSVLFRLLVAIALRWGLNPNDLKLITAIFVFAALVLPGLVRKFKRKSRRRMLDIRGVSKTFNAGTPNEVRALRNVNLKLDEGSFVTIIGTNGSGKTTLLNSVAGTFYVDHGSIDLAGSNITRWPEHRRAKLIGRVFQNPFSGTAPNMTIAENIVLASRRGHPRGLGWALKPAFRRELRDRIRSLNMGLEDRIDNAIGSLSGGQRQALTLLMATWLKPQLLLLDEHTAALDPKSADQVIRLSEQIISRDKLTTFMVTHSMHQAVNLGDRIIMMHRGQVLHDLRGAERQRARPDDLLARFDEIRRRESLDANTAEMLRRNYI